MKRGLLVVVMVLGTLGTGLAAPALASTDAVSSGTTICVQMPLHKPTDPGAPGYCVWVPGR